MEPDPTELVRLYVDEGLGLAVIGRRFGHTADWVRARLVAAGVPVRPAGRKPAITDVQVRSLLDRGLRVAEIAKELGVTDSSVLDRMRARGWTGPPRRPRGPSRNAPSLPPVEILRQLYVTEGFSVAEVAQRLGQSRGRVIAALDAAGISRRRPGWTDGTPPDVISRGLLIKLYLEDSKTVREVAAALDTTTTRVNAALRRHGIPRRPEPTAPPTLRLDRSKLTELYVTRRLDDDAIGLRYGVPAWRVTMRRRELYVHRPPVAPPHPEPPVMPAAADLHRWYVLEGRTLEQIARAHHTSRDTVRTWLEAAGVSVQPRTSREHRKHLDPVLLRELYLTREWTATEIAAELDTSIQLVLRTLHDHDIPVRRGGPPRKRDGDTALRRLAALYQDPDIVALLRRHRIPERPMAGTITERFPIPVEVTRPFLTEAYAEIGLAAGHIEQLTGQPAERVLQLLHEQDIPIRQPGTHSPWLQRQRS